MHANTEELRAVIPSRSNAANEVSLLQIFGTTAVDSTLVIVVEQPKRPMSAGKEEIGRAHV